MKLRDHDAITSKFDGFKVDPRKLRTEPGFNIRNLDTPDAQEALQDLKDSIRTEGVQVPLEIRMADDELYIVSGHRRHRAVMELIAEGCEIDTVPAVAEPKTINDAERTLRLITMNSGEPLTSLEKAEVVRRLLGHGWEREKIQHRLGYRTMQTIANFETLLAAPETVRQAVSGGEISATEAVSMVREHGEKASEALKAARATARERGRPRITKRSIALAPTAKSDKPHYAADLDRAINMLIDVAEHGYGAKTMASAYIARSAFDVRTMLDWLTEFEDALRCREDEKSHPAARSETAADAIAGTEA